VLRYEGAIISVGMMGFDRKLLLCMKNDLVVVCSHCVLCSSGKVNENCHTILESVYVPYDDNC
jgi:hypothetical protein